MDVASFISDRVAEEETLAQAAIDGHPAAEPWDYDDVRTDGSHITHWSPWRVMSACVAKRLILAVHRKHVVIGADGDVVTIGCSMCRQDADIGRDWPCYTIRTLALEYADHEDYRYEWRPHRLRAMH